MCTEIVETFIFWVYFTLTSLDSYKVVEHLVYKLLICGKN
jgi:hypothetical protein